MRGVEGFGCDGRGDEEGVVVDTAAAATAACGVDDAAGKMEGGCGTEGRSW